MVVNLFTSNYVPGCKVDKVVGLVYGITVRSRGIGGNIMAGLRTLGGGEIHEYTELAHQARQQALDRLSQQAETLGANAVISVMFDSTEIGHDHGRDNRLRYSCRRFARGRRPAVRQAELGPKASTTGTTLVGRPIRDASRRSSWVGR